ncbi:MAG: EF-hand domain-containing protein [Pseudomonadota bacterium]|nr:EF-hand domain-containing protein [Pseudomonadota bacterium]
MHKPLTAAALALASGLAFAAHPAFSEADANGDGAVDQDEAAAIEGLDFTAADTDQNGSLSEEEYNAATQAMEGEAASG